MAFLVYRTDGNFLVNTGLTFRLAGYNLIYRIWETRGKPIDRGWHITRDDLAANYDPPSYPEKPYRFVIDFDPNATWRIGLIEILDIYVYTYPASKDGEAEWSPMMLRLRDVLYDEYRKDISAKQKTMRIARIREPKSNCDFVEFLYLNGSKKSWNWGTNGMTNAAFIQGAARKFFRQYF